MLNSIVSTFVRNNRWEPLLSAPKKKGVSLLAKMLFFLGGGEFQVGTPNLVWVLMLCAWYGGRVV